MIKMTFPQFNLKSPLIILIPALMAGGSSTFYFNSRTYHSHIKSINQTFESHTETHDIGNYTKKDTVWRDNQLALQQGWKAHNPIYRAIVWPPNPSYMELLD